MAKTIDPIGVTYKWQEGNIDYQLFPEDYFSGADVYLYFGDIWAEEVISLEFVLSEQVLPIFGYASYTWDYVTRGARMVTGQFRIAFKDSGYLYSILDHIGQLYQKKEKAVPYLAYAAGGSDAVTIYPAWLRDAKGRIGDILTDFKSYQASTVQKAAMHIAAEERPVLREGDTDETKDNWVSKMQAALQSQKPDFCVGACSTDDWRDDMGEEDSGEDVAQLQRRLIEYGALDGGEDDGSFGPATAAALEYFQEMAGLDADGVCGGQTRVALASGFSVDGDFGKVTRAVLFRYQVYKEIGADGACGNQTWSLLLPGPAAGGSGTPSVSASSIGNISDKLGEGGDGNNVWERSLDSSRAEKRKRKPYFYAGTTTMPLKQKGFDICAVFGPAPEYALNNSIAGGLPFNTTLRGIRNIQITGVQQIYDPGGQPIEEVYSFIAQDLD